MQVARGLEYTHDVGRAAGLGDRECGAAAQQRRLIARVEPRGGEANCQANLGPGLAVGLGLSQLGNFGLEGLRVSRDRRCRLRGRYRRRFLEGKVKSRDRCYKRDNAQDASQRRPRLARTV